MSSPLTSGRVRFVAAFACLPVLAASAAPAPAQGSFNVTWQVDRRA